MNERGLSWRAAASARGAADGGRIGGGVVRPHYPAWLLVGAGRGPRASQGARSRAEAGERLCDRIRAHADRRAREAVEAAAPGDRAGLRAPRNGDDRRGWGGLIVALDRFKLFRGRRTVSKNFDGDTLDGTGEALRRSFEPA